MVAIKLGHAVWAEVAAFLGRNDRYSLMALSSDVVDSPLRRQFFEQSAWRIPPTSTLADRVALNLSVKRSIRRIEISFTWQQAYLSDFPELEHVVINVMDEGGDEEEDDEDDWDDERTIDFVLSSTIPATVKRLSMDWLDGVPSMTAFSHLVNLEELKLDVASVSDGNALLPLTKLAQLSINLRGDAEDEDYAFLSGLRHLRKLSVGIPEVRADTFPVLSPLEDVEFMYGTAVMSMDTLVRVAPQLKRLTFGCSLSLSSEDIILFAISARLGAALTSIEELDLRDVHYGASPRELAVISRLTTLKKLCFPVEEKLSSLAALSGLTQLEELEVGARPRADWSPLQGMKNLRSLHQWGDAGKWNESSMRTLSTLPLLTTLMVPTKLSGRFPLPQVKKTELWNESNRPLVFDADCCVNVTELKMYGPFDVASLVRCFPNVESFSVVEWLPDVHPRPSPLANLPHLKFLSVLVDPSNARKLAFLADMTGIQSLVLQSIGDLALLRGMKSQLRELTLQSAPSHNISVLAELTRLRKLNLERCAIGSLVCLRGHPSLVVLRLPYKTDYSELVAEDGECSLPNLKELWVGWKRVF